MGRAKFASPGATISEEMVISERTRNAEYIWERCDGLREIGDSLDIVENRNMYI